ncbi:MAG TPA: ATP-dependent helicase HrpB [Bacteroidia bacterium]|jgi:ATP-dependent helicase HrpB|nr:ATP-dependent helicase HrpB [Bacteroidia bacterium]
MSEQLPIYDILPEIRSTLANHNTVILQAPPGAGKSTALPLELLEEPWLKGKRMLMLEPRRLAARAAASRMSDLLHENVGATVGYKVRFENKTTKATRIEVLTEGILTRMLQQDDALDNVGLVIFDEFHERSLHADLALALCREIQQVLREDLRILIMSATLDSGNLSSLLKGAPILNSQGRQYPVNIIYDPGDSENNIPLQVSRGIGRALREQKGDILAFLPGAGEIHRCMDILETQTSGVKLHPLFGDLPLQKQQEALMPDRNGYRKIVLATSIAETSLTIEGIGVVVDSGYSRAPRFDPRTGLTRLETIRVTADAADQRAGRAGRLGPGVCYRLWSAGAQHQLIPHRKPEILEADLAPLVLELANWGTSNIKDMAWLTQPPSAGINLSRELLRQLDALAGDKITPKGKEMLKLPTHPRIAHLLLEAREAKLTSLGSDIAAILEERDPLPKEAGADLVLRIEALRKWRNKEYVAADRARLERIERLAESWRKIFSIQPDNNTPLQEHAGKLIAMAYPERVARQHGPDHRYKLSNGRFAKTGQHDPLSREKWLAIASLDGGNTEGAIYLAAPLDPEDILKQATQQELITWDSQKGELVARTEIRFGEITVSSKPLQKIPEEARLAVLLSAAESEGLKLFSFSEETNEWLDRLRCLKKWRPDENWPDVSEQHLLQSMNEWLSPWLGTVKRREDFLKLDMHNILNALLPWDMKQRFDSLAPASLKVPSGSMIRLKYMPEGTAPVLAVRLQEMFGLLDTPAVNEGRNKVILHLLSPGYKPVQVTQDLQSFWKNTYPEVRKELRVRYQKHHWPEDPWTAEAVRGARKKKAE